MIIVGKDLKGKNLGTGLRQRKDGRYEARAQINGIAINLYNLNLKELKRDFQDAKNKAKNRIDYKRNNITLNEWFDEWFTNYKIPNIKPQSIVPMKSKYYNNFGTAIGNMKVTDITNLDIQRVINEMAGKGLATSTMREALGRVRECLESAKNNRIIDINPCFEIIVPWKNKNVEKCFLSMQQQQRFLQEINNTWYKEMFHVMFLTGLRIGEVGGLKWEDIDWSKKQINVKRSLCCQYEYGVKTLRLTEPKTPNSYRSIPFMGNVEEMLLSQQLKQKKQKELYGERWRSQGEFDDFVFTTSLGSPVVRHIAEKEVRKAVDRINHQEEIDALNENREPIKFPPAHPHAIRHTFATRCFESGMNPKVVQQIMGHAHYSTTIDIYTHVTEQKYRNEIDKFNNRLKNSSADFTQSE